MRELFEPWKPREDALERLAQCQRIVAEYMGQDLRLTLRQLYYQLVARGWIPNTERSYKNVGELLSRARLAGYIDWEAIEDRGRKPHVPNEFANLDELVEAALRSYRLPRWQSQPRYVELWVEKEALAGVLEPIARAHHVPLMVNKGYSSSSAIEYRGDLIFATQTGVDWLGDDFEPLPTGDALREHWLKHLPNGNAAVLRVVCDAYPDALDRETISERTGYTRSTRNRYIAELASPGLIERDGDGLRASAELFG